MAFIAKAATNDAISAPTRRFILFPAAIIHPFQAK
jgi:hypothetical protein